MSVIKSRELSGWSHSEVAEEVWEVESVRDLIHLCWRETMWKAWAGIWQPLGGDTGPSWQPARKRGAQSYKQKELTWPTTWMPLEANSFPKPWERKSALLTNWIWFCDTGSRGHGWTTLYLVFWPIYCELTNYRSNRKLQKQC